MRDTIETQHLDEAQFGIFDDVAEEFLIEPDEINAFIDNNESVVVLKAIVDSTRLTFDDLKDKIGKELIDLYNQNRDD